MTHRVVLSLLTVLALVLVACQSAAPAAPTTAPAKPAEAAKPAASPAAPAASPAAPAASPAAPAASPVASPAASPVASRAGQPFPTGSYMRAIQDRGTLRAGVKQDVLLFGYLNPRTNRIEGFDVDIAKEIARAIFGDAEKVSLQGMPSAARIPAL